MVLVLLVLVVVVVVCQWGWGERGGGGVQGEVDSSRPVHTWDVLSNLTLSGALHLCIHAFTSR
jgi:hypothetical protein